MMFDTVWSNLSKSYAVVGSTIASTEKLHEIYVNYNILYHVAIKSNQIVLTGTNYYGFILVVGQLIVKLLMFDFI